MVDDVIVLRGKEVPVTIELVDQMSLRFYSENPRIYSHLWTDGSSNPSQQEIFEVLSKSEHVRDTLLPSIRANGGLIEPLLVKKSVVLEGNSRLAAYRLLGRSGDKKWKMVRVRRLPDSLDDDDIFALLGEYHLVGKKDWQPFEQAGYLYRRHKHHNVPIKDLKNHIGIRESRIVHFINVYQFMLDKGDRDPTRWSFYDELLKGRKFNKAISQYPAFRETVVEKIKSGEIERAVDLRDSLPLITKAGGNTLKKFMSGAYSFDEAVDDAKLRGAGDYNSRRIHDFRVWLSDQQIDVDFRAADSNQRKHLRFELEKLERRVGGLKKLTAEDKGR